ncbi:phage tail protein I [Acinetobacter guillouiae]|uniref:phage tail protein I n=1 Tax=Acinetobacter guillouiae TaxID=106649 RepID=UPI0012502D83|nr:phage tail protein I [Acinetobacter guillouiae]
MSKLLPPNATKLEKNIEQLGEKITALPVPFVDLHRIHLCPVAHLPWLAWEHRVEYWQPNWAESQKRNAITESKAFNAQRGTRSSIESLLSTVVPQFQLTPWHALIPKQPPFTFIVNIPTSYLLTIDQLLQVLTAIEATKSARDEYSITAKVKIESHFNVVGASHTGATVYLSTI